MLTIHSPIHYRVASVSPTERDTILLPIADASNEAGLTARLQAHGLTEATAKAAVSRLQRQSFKAKPGEVNTITDLTSGTTVLLVGVHADPDERFDARGARQNHLAQTGMRKLVEAVKAERGSKLLLDLSDSSLWQGEQSLYGNRDAGLVAAHLIHAMELAYAPLPKQVKEPKPDPTPETVTVLVPDAAVAATTAAVERERVLAAAAHLVRVLTVMPANELSLDRYQAHLTDLAADDPQLSLHVWDRAALEAAGADAIVAVGRAATSPPRIISLSYTPASGATATAAIVGKGIVYDTGGLSIKPSKYMLGMHDDMSGSAAAAALVWAAAKLKLPFAVKAYLGLAENAIGPDAYRPGDILRTMNGKTIEVIDTDAEGRLVLADTLTMAQQDGKPELLLDFATLTGSCLRALGEVASGVFGNRESLYATAVDVGYETGDRVWAFPNWPDYGKVLESKVADIKQCSADAGPDMLNAFCFLNEFVSPELPWLHVDMASVRNDDGLGAAPGGYTGFGPRFGLSLIERLMAK